MDVTEFFGLNAFPFTARGTAPVVTPPVRAAAAALARHIDSGVPAIVIIGVSGSGKSFLLQSLANDPRLAHARPRFVSGHRDVGPDAFDTTELLLIDEAEHADPDRLRALAAAAARRDKRLVLATAAHESPLPDAPAIAVEPMSRAGALSFLEAHFVRSADRFPFDRAAAEAIAAAGASPRRLKALAGAALVEAMVDGAATVGPDHAARAIAEMPLVRPSPDRPADVEHTTGVVAPVAATPAKAPAKFARPHWISPVLAASLAAILVLWPQVAGSPSLPALPALPMATPVTTPAAPPAELVSVAAEPAVQAATAEPAPPTISTPVAPASLPAAVANPRAAQPPASSKQPIALKPAKASAAAPRRAVRILIRYAADAPPPSAESAYALAGMLEREGWRIAGVQPAPAAFGSARTLYFDDADRALAGAIGREVAAAAERSPGPGRRGTVEVWLPS